MKLYDIAVEGQLLESILEETGGELTPELEARFDHFLAGGREKINAALCVRRRLEYEAKACRDEADRLWARAKSLENQRHRLGERVLMAVDLGFGGKVKTAYFTAYGVNSKDTHEYRLSPDVDMVKFCDENPDLTRVSRELNKSALNDLLKDGGQLPREIEAQVVPGKRSLLVR